MTWWTKKIENYVLALDGPKVFLATELKNKIVFGGRRSKIVFIDLQEAKNPENIILFSHLFNISWKARNQYYLICT